MATETQGPRSPEELKSAIEEIRSGLSWARDYLDPPAQEARLADLDRQMEAPGFWDDQQKAAKISSERARVQRKLETMSSLESEVAELDSMLELADEEPEWRDELERSVDRLSGDVGRLQEDALFTGEYDSGPAVVTIHAGAGGTDSQDWTEILFRMYQRWADSRGFKVEVLDQTPGEEAGLKSVTFTLTGDNAYGIMQAEKGVHRLVRLSPFDSAHRRHTSFTQVELAPLVEDDVDVEIADDDLRIDTYRSQGAGGQHVNKTDSAVRITHIPTGIVVQCQNERSQTQNKATAMQMLRARLIAEEERKREEEMAAARGEQKAVEWGSQIRSYTLHPTTRVKDHRTNHEVGDAQRVLDGDLDGFIREYLLQSAAGTTASTS